MKNLKLNNVIFNENSLEVIDYPFTCTKEFNNKIVFANEITDSDLSFSPPVIRKGDELLFVLKDQKKELEDFLNRNSIQNIKHDDIWSMVLDPFLDTELNDEYYKKTKGKLKKNGLSNNEIDLIREMVSPQITIYNSYLWEWVYLGLFDILSASYHFMEKNSIDFIKFYFIAMDIALKSFNKVEI